MGISANLSDIIQKESLDLGSAACLIQATIDTFDSLQSDDAWNLLWEQIDIASPVGKARCQRQPLLL